jgi:hypothetical protein
VKPETEWLLAFAREDPKKAKIILGQEACIPGLESGGFLWRNHGWLDCFRVVGLVAVFVPPQPES